MKTPFEFIDLNFTAAMARNFAEGIKDDRTRDGWKELKWDEKTEAMYRGKLLRHFHEYQLALQSGDHIGAEKNLAAVACNANILHFHL